MNVCKVTVSSEGQHIMCGRTPSTKELRVSNNSDEGIFPFRWKYSFREFLRVLASKESEFHHIPRNARNSRHSFVRVPKVTF